MLKSSMGRLRIVAFLEGVSFLVILGVTMPMKYLMDMPAANKVVGLVHGVLFMLYVLMVLMVSIERRWAFMKVFWAMLASILPFGTFVADAKIFRKEQEPEL